MSFQFGHKFNMNKFKGNYVIKNLFTITGCSLLLSFQALAQLTNHVEIKPGFYFEVVNSSGAPSDHFESGQTIRYILSTTNHEALLGRNLSPSQSFVFNLHDAAGHSIPKTNLGFENSELIGSNKPVLYSRFAITSYSWPGRIMFRPDEYFVMTNNGIYTLEAQLRIWMLTTNRQNGVVIISPLVRVQVEKR